MMDAEPRRLRDKMLVLNHGRELKNLLNYNCIFDEKASQLNMNKPHKHKVIKAWEINKEGYITDGIAFIGDDGIFRTGCCLKDFDLEA
ncbi:MAG: hypothetical protein GWN93_26920 [Deltaproteobacteria bacterium]|nr:hypothetical protein [Deltaproteobacteria bacterium]